jgi:REP element-mobilizing transposase RayT
MSRPLRVEFAGACYHVINRGNYRRNLFAGRGAAEAFERTLGEAATRFGWQVHAYVVMRNHFHLALEIAEPDLSEGMKWLQGTWIRRYNGYRHLVGRPFQGRYKALLVEPGNAFGQVCHYIHLNPVRAGVVPAAKAVEYPWSSLPKFAGKDRLEWLDGSTVLAAAGGLPDTAAGWKKYLEYLEFLATDAGAQKELVAARMSRGWCLGGAEFKREMRREAAQRGADLERYGGLEPEEARREREETWGERLAAFARAAGIDLARLPPRKSDPGKALLAAAMKQSTSVPNGWLSERLGMGQPASASQFVRRYLLGRAGREKVDRLLSRVKT